MIKKMLLALALPLTGFVCVMPASAADVRVEFTAQQFRIYDGFILRPVDLAPIHGFIDYRTFAWNDEIDAVLGIALTIDGHRYTVDELYDVRFTRGDHFGGAQSAGGMTSGTDDFRLINSSTGQYFEYTTVSGPETMWVAGDVSIVYRPLAAVPEPAPVAMLLAGLGYIAWVCRRRHQLADNATIQRRCRVAAT